RMASAQLRAAFELLAARLDGSPFAKSLPLHRVVIERLELGILPVDELLSARGAERLAADLYRRITGGLGWPRAPTSAAAHSRPMSRRIRRRSHASFHSASIPRRCRAS